MRKKKAYTEHEHYISVTYLTTLRIIKKKKKRKKYTYMYLFSYIYLSVDR